MEGLPEELPEERPKNEHKTKPKKIVGSLSVALLGYDNTEKVNLARLLAKQTQTNPRDLQRNDLFSYLLPGVVSTSFWVTHIASDDQYRLNGTLVNDSAKKYERSLQFVSGSSDVQLIVIDPRDLKALDNAKNIFTRLDSRPNFNKKNIILVSSDVGNVLATSDFQTKQKAKDNIKALQEYAENVGIRFMEVSPEPAKLKLKLEAQKNGKDVNLPAGVTDEEDFYLKQSVNELREKIYSGFDMSKKATTDYSTKSTKKSTSANNSSFLLKALVVLGNVSATLMIATLFFATIPAMGIAGRNLFTENLHNRGGYFNFFTNDTASNDIKGAAEGPVSNDITPLSK